MDYSSQANYTDRYLSAKLVPTFIDIGVSRSQRGVSPRQLTSIFYTGVATT
jgi:hypothetical protein